MHIGATWFNDSFNVELSSVAGKEAFLVIKGCRLVQGQKGEFVSFPAKKLESGKYWNHCYASEAFQVAVIDAAQKSRPAADTRTHGERKRGGDMDDAPF